MKKTLLSVLLIFALVVTAVTPLCSCLGKWFAKKTPTKEEIAENIQTDEENTLTQVAEYLLHWDLPDFFSSDFSYFEAVLKARFYPDNDTAHDVAQQTANLFLDTAYDEVKDSGQMLVTPRLLYCYFEVLASRDTAISDADLSAASADTTAHDYVMQYLFAWGFPVFDGLKLLQAEKIVEYYFYKKDTLPDAYAIAKSILDDYLAAEEKPATLDELTDLLLHDYVLSLDDRYAYYRTPVEDEEYDSDMSGKFTGIGVTVEYTYATDIITVTGVIDGSPAEGAGLRPGDILYAVNGETAQSLGYDETVNHVRGEVGTSVTVTVLRGDEYIDFTMIRKELDDVTVSYTMTGDVAVIRITQFKANTGTQFKEVLDAAVNAGALGIVFDMRSNPGGYLSAVVEAISYLVPQNTPVVSFTSYYGGDTAEGAIDDHTLTLPCVVLCNGYTASAGELFTAALRDYDEMGLLDATVVGETTYKKGIMQETRSLWDGSTVTLTVAYYNPPSGVNYDGVGVTPDEVVTLSEGADSQKARALEILNAKLHPEQ